MKDVEPPSDDPVKRYSDFYDGQSRLWRAWNRLTWVLFTWECRIRGKEPIRELMERAERRNHEKRKTED